MNRFRSGLVPLIALVAVVGCSSEPTGDLRDGLDRLVASPTQLFIEVGETKTVEVGGVDAQGNPLDFNYEVTAVGSGIAVRRDSSFLPIFVNDSTLQAPAIGPRFRFIVEGQSYTATNFTVAAGGKEVVIPVQVIPEAGLAATFDDDTVDLGQTVTLTAPAGVTFADNAVLTIGTDTLTILSQDASTIAFIPPPSVNSPVTIHGVVSASTPDLVFAPATQTTLVTPLIDTVDVTYSTTAPTLGQTVTLTSPNPLINLVVDSLIFPGQLPGREADPQNIVVAADSSSLTFSAPPNIDGSGTVVNFHFPGDYLRALPTRPNVTGANIGLALPAPVSNAAPAVGEPVTLTAPAGFSFDVSIDTIVDVTDPEAPESTFVSPLAIAVGGNAAIVTDIAADGSTVEFVPIPGSIGIPQIDGVVPDASPANILTMPAETEITTAAEVPVLPGTDDPSTAPSLITPALNEAAVVFDVPDFAASGFFRFYELTITTAGTYTVTVDWNVGSDIDFYFCETPLAPDFSNCEFPGATAAHPEVGTFALTPGDYIVAVNDFGEDAADTRLTLKVEHGLVSASGVALRTAAASAGLRKTAPADLSKLRRLLNRK